MPSFKDLVEWHDRRGDLHPSSVEMLEAVARATGREPPLVVRLNRGEFSSCGEFSLWKYFSRDAGAAS
jgi:hypothetical protein